MSNIKVCPYCGEDHPVVKIATVIDYDEEGNPILGEYKDFINLTMHDRNAYIPLEVWQKPLYQR